VFSVFKAKNQVVPRGTYVPSFKSIAPVVTNHAVLTDVNGWRKHVIVMYVSSLTWAKSSPCDVHFVLQNTVWSCTYRWVISCKELHTGWFLLAVTIALATAYDDIIMVERRGRMVRTSDSQPEGCGFESQRGICEQEYLKIHSSG
jgi:hypothetical protein